MPTKVKQTKKIFSGVVWNSIEKILQNAFSFVVNLILARLLAPEYFGIIGMAIVFTGLVETMGDLGMNAALIQRKAKDLYPEDYDTAFWAGLAWGGSLFVFVAFALAPIAAWFYDEQILASIIALIGVSLLFRPLTMVHEIDINRDLNFKLLAFANNGSQFLGGAIAIGMAYFGFGVWSLVFHKVTITIFRVPLLWKVNPWRPEFRFKKRSFQKIFGFGIYTTLTSLFNFLYNNVDYLLIGKMLGPSPLGIYTLSFMLTDNIRSKVMEVMRKVMYPVYGQEQDNKEQLKKYYLKIVKYNCILIYPVMGVLLIYSKDLVPLIFGEEWSQATAPLQILSISVMIHLLVNSNTTLIRGMGKPNIEMYVQLGKALFIFMPLIIIGIYFFGVIGAALAVLINKIIAVFIAHLILNRLIDIKLREFVNALSKPIGLFGVTTMICYAVYNIYDEFMLVHILVYITFNYSLMYIYDKDIKKILFYFLQNDIFGRLMK